MMSAAMARLPDVAVNLLVPDVAMEPSRDRSLTAVSVVPAADSVKVDSGITRESAAVAVTRPPAVFVPDHVM